MIDPQQLLRPANTPEEADTRRAKQEEWEALGNIPLDLGEARNALGGIGEVDPETGMQTVDEIRTVEAKDPDNNPDLILAALETDAEIHDDTLYDRSSPEGEIYDRIAARIDTQFGGNPEILVPELFDEQARERNAARADELFFSDSVLEDQMRSAGEASESENLQANQEWFEANMGEGGPLSESFERIRGNFVLPPHISGNNLQEIYESGSEQDALIVNAALSDAFLLEIEQHTLQGRINYPKEQVESLIREIENPENSPFEKLKLFGQIHTVVETGVGGRGKKQTEAFRNTQRRSAATQKQVDAFHIAQTQRVEAAEVENNSGPDIEVPIAETQVGGGDIFTAGDLDLTGKNETAQEAT